MDDQILYTDEDGDLKVDDRGIYYFERNCGCKTCDLEENELNRLNGLKDCDMYKCTNCSSYCCCGCEDREPGE